MSKYEYKIGDKIEIISLTEFDNRNSVYLGDNGIISETWDNEEGCYVTMKSNRVLYMYYNQIKLIATSQSIEKYVKCIEDEYSKNILELNKSYKTIGETLNHYKLEVDMGWWHKSRFEEIPNSQNLVKSSVSEPTKSNKMELLMPVLDIIERLQELEVDKDNIEEMIARIESDEAIESSNRWYELKIQELEYENSKLQKENVDLYSYITKISEMTRTCIIDRL